MPGHRSSGARARPRALLFAAIVVMLAVMGFAEAMSNREAPRQLPSPRAVAYAPCPRVVPTTLPDGFQLIERRLKALSKNHMGSAETYTRGREWVRVFSGPDVLDILEDMELRGRDIQSGGKRFVLYTSEVQPELLIGVLRDERLEEPCNTVAVQARNVALHSMLLILSGVEVSDRTEVWGVSDRWEE